MNWLKHAFDTSGPDEPPTAEQGELIEKLCQEIVRRRMALPALVFLEMSQPLNSLSAQALHFLSPVLSMFGNSTANDASPAVEGASKSKPHELLAQYLERPGSIAAIADRIEALEKARAATDSGEGASSASE